MNLHRGFSLLAVVHPSVGATQVLYSEAIVSSRGRRDQVLATQEDHFIFMDPVNGHVSIHLTSQGRREVDAISVGAVLWRRDDGRESQGQASRQYQ